MKKIVIASVLTYAVFLFLILLLLFPGSAGAGDYDSKVVATEDQAYNYQYIASELGVPWDIVILCDAILAKQDGLSGIEDINPLVTALEFCVLQEDIYTLQTVYDEESMANSFEWKLLETVLYTGCDEILAYIERTRDEIEVRDVTDIVVEINQTAVEKCTAESKYDVTLLSNLDYEYVIRELIGLMEGDIKGVLELYHAQYMAELYGYMPEKEDFASIHVPPMVPGTGITRYDLAKVAVSLINWPYQLGSKSPYQGTPRVPLDCSGYVDWVYIQCFGIGVSAGGRIPAGVAVSGTAIQYYASDPVSKSDLKIGDLGFLKDPRNVKYGEYNHVGIYIGNMNGKQVWVHCAGKSYGYAERPNGRVGISLSSGSNSYDPITGTSFEPAMKSINFQYFHRPRFEFADDLLETENE